jgi:hypothetical protein
MVFQNVSGCLALLLFKPADRGYAFLHRRSVVAMPYCVLGLLKPIFGPPESEWLLYSVSNPDKGCP